MSSTASSAATSKAANQILVPSQQTKAESGRLMMSSFPKLFSPISLGARRPVTQLSCRALMNPIYLGVEENHSQHSGGNLDFWNIMAEFYALRARGGCPLIITGGVSPSLFGRWYPQALTLNKKELVSKYKMISDAVHDEGGKILLQMYHGGRMACSPLMLAASGGDKALPPFRFYKWSKPIGLPRFALRYVITEYMRCAELAKAAGFDGVEIPACYGTFLHSFLMPGTNKRGDDFGGDTLENRARALLQTIDAVRQVVPDEDFLLSCRLSVHDLLPKGQGSTRSDVNWVASQIAEGGLVDLLCCVTGTIESPVQTTSSYVPRGAFHSIIKDLKDHLKEEHPDHGMVIAACNGRYPVAEVVETTLEEDVCDMVGLGRPLLADCNYLLNARESQPLMTMPCIGCNRCLDLSLKAKRVSCAINPIAGWELEYLPLKPVEFPKQIAVVGAGPTGITCALTLARRGHTVHLYEENSEIGGQLNLAKVIPGKEDYWFLLEHWTHVLKRTPNIHLKMNSKFEYQEVTLGDQHFEAVVVCVGSQPRPASSHTGGLNIEHKNVVSFMDVLTRKVRPGRRVVVLGKGAIAYDVCSYLLHDPKITREVTVFANNFGIDLENKNGIDTRVLKEAPPLTNNREVTLFQNLNNDTGLMRCKKYSQRSWLKQHGASLIECGMVGKFTDEGLHFSTPLPEQKSYIMPVDTVVYAGGMIPNWGPLAYLHDWFTFGSPSYGMAPKDWAVYIAGSCRDIENMEAGGDQDLYKVCKEGFDVGARI